MEATKKNAVLLTIDMLRHNISGRPTNAVIYQHFAREYSFSSGLGTDLPDEPLMLVASFIVVAWLVTNFKKQPVSIHPLILIVLLQLCSGHILHFIGSNKVLRKV